MPTYTFSEKRVEVIAELEEAMRKGRDWQLFYDDAKKMITRREFLERFGCEPEDYRA
jgi:hypothetical protein